MFRLSLDQKEISFDARGFQPSCESRFFLMPETSEAIARKKSTFAARLESTPAQKSLPEKVKGTGCALATRPFKSASCEAESFSQSWPISRAFSRWRIPFLET